MLKYILKSSKSPRFVLLKDVQSLFNLDISFIDSRTGFVTFINSKTGFVTFP